MVSREERAKQFMPFDALKGLQEALREKERQLEFVDKVELCEEVIEDISEKLQILEVDSLVKVKYYFNKKYNEVYGKVKEVNKVKKKLLIEIEESLKIKNQKDIYKIKKQEEIEIRFCDIIKLEET